MDCVICGHLTCKFEDEKTEINYYQCGSCEVIFKAPECHQTIAEQKKRYDLHENDPQDEGYQAYFQRFLDFILPQVGSPKEALDFGCGRSRLLATLLEKHGIECSPYDPIYHPDTLMREAQFDLIVSTEVFEHLHDPKEVFGRLVSYLKPEGYLALQTQFHPIKHHAFKAWYYHQDPTHIVFFTPRTFEVLAEMFEMVVIAKNQRNMIVLQKCVASVSLPEVCYDIG